MSASEILGRKSEVAHHEMPMAKISWAKMCGRDAIKFFFFSLSLFFSSLPTHLAEFKLGLLPCHVCACVCGISFCLSVTGDISKSHGPMYTKLGIQVCHVPAIVGLNKTHLISLTLQNSSFDFFCVLSG